MKRYFESHIDFSEIESITTNEEQITATHDELAELGLLNGKKINPEPISEAIQPEMFFNRIDRRMRNRPSGLENMVSTLHMLYDRRDYYAVYLYVVFLFGFVQWRTPHPFAVLAANPDYLKQYLPELLQLLDEYMLSRQAEETGGESL